MNGQYVQERMDYFQDFNPTLVRFELVNAITEEQRMENFNPTLVRFELEDVLHELNLTPDFNPTLVRFELVNYHCIFCITCISILP